VAHSPLCSPWLRKRRQESPNVVTAVLGMARMGNKSICHTKFRKVPNRPWGASAVLALAIGALTPTAGYAWTSVGEYRNFPATLIVPQVTSTDGFWFTPNTQPFQGVAPMMNKAPTAHPTTRQSQFSGTYSKMITQELGIQLSDGLERDDRLGAKSVSGAQNFNALLQYEAYRSPRDSPHEFVLSFQVEQSFGSTGDKNLKSYQRSFTQPGITFAKGFGDLPISYLQPLAITGFTGYQFGEGGASSSPKGNQVNAGFSVQYSIPYLVSKVARVDLPGWLRGMTPMIEMLYATSSGNGHASTTLKVAPGVSYSPRIVAWSWRSRPRYQPTRPPAVVGG
jgi:hypothetical protein